MYELLGNRARGTLVHELRRRGPLGTPELAQVLGTSHVTTYRHLMALEQGGLVSGDIPPAERQGRAVLWSLNRDRLRQLLDELAQFLDGDD